MDYPDKFGYYKVDALKFYSRFDAEQFAAKTGKPLTWHFNDEEFSNFDWTVEPAQSLEALYAARARQLREKYDHLVLWYSGGSDSQNILDSFVKNDIPLDEVASYTNYDATGNKHDWLNGEIYNLTVPIIKNIQDTSQPWLKHTIVDISQLAVDFFKNSVNKFDWIYNVNYFLGPNNLARTSLIKNQPAWQKIIDQGKRVGFVWGLEKSKVLGINGQYYTTFQDTVDQAVPVGHQHTQPAGVFYELFYWSPDCKELLAKQAHTIKQFFKSVDITSPYLTDNLQKGWNSRATVNGKIKYLTTEGTNRLLYPSWHKVPFQVKPASIIFTRRDTWFFNLPDNDTAKHQWRNGIMHRWASTADSLKNDPLDMSKGFTVLNSKYYSLGY
jgi:hypothetical protein